MLKIKSNKHQGQGSIEMKNNSIHMTQKQIVTKK